MIRFPQCFIALALACLAVPACRPSAAATLAENSAAARSDDSLVTAAAAELAQGRPWRASRLLAPVVRDPSRRTPEAVLLAATAASRWDGWDQVQQLLEAAPWRDTIADGRALGLLARAALAQRNDSAAARYALAAADRADGDLSEGERFVLAARAFDRLEQGDTAAALYRRGAALLPDIGDWLYLRAAAVSSDSGVRQSDYAQLKGRIAPSRIGWTEESAREHSGDLLGAAHLADSLGAPAQAVGLRLAAASDSASRADIRGDLAALIAARTGSGTARDAAHLLDSAFAPLSAEEELLVARSANRSGPASRAAVGFKRALDAGIAAPTDRLAYAELLVRLDRPLDAAKQYALIPAKSSLGAEAAYGRARALVRGGRLTEGKRELVALGNHFPDDTAWAAIALYLRADLATDDRDDPEARALFLMLAHRYPTSRRAPAARFRAAIIALANGDAASAAFEFDSLAVLYPRSDDALAARYWGGRAWFATGDTSGAVTRWSEVLRRDPLSYYAALSARRLGQSPWAPAAADDSFRVYPSLDSAMARAALLERVGLDREAGWEYAQVVKDAGDSVERLLSTADAFRAHGRASQAITLARRALAHGAESDARVYRLIYPATHTDALVADAAEQGLDPAFVAALVRQESMFNPAARSGAGARGLMQLMPKVGHGLARSLDFPFWDPVLLYQPDVNLQLGTIHLSELARRYDAQVHILAAYNAGASRVDRWSDKVGVDDPELFAERIPYTETRDYVRIIARNESLYRALYDWDGELMAASQSGRGTASAAGGGR